MAVPFDGTAFVREWAMPLARSTEGEDMTKEQALEMLKLLSALESWSFSTKHDLPDYLHERLCAAIDQLTCEVLK